ncbi:MAG TPA: exopolysaccharide biosynthesis protein [Opitutaceae bacterium]|nr:exopolysaccharide biosynthesis protein [Opitutaceae bacterium]
MGTNAAPDPNAPAPIVVAAPVPRKLSDELQRLIDEFATGSVTVRELIVVLQGRAYDFLLLLLALPFLLPVPLLGLSTPFGTVIAIIAARLMLGQRPWLPVKLLDTTLPPKFFPTLLAGARRILRLFELFLRPRLLWLTATPLPQLHAFIIFVAAVLLLLPLPPGTNFPPALCIVIMAAGLLERDGLFVLGGYVVFALNMVFFALFGFYGTKLFEVIWHWLRGLVH